MDFEPVPPIDNNIPSFMVTDIIVFNGPSVHEFQHTCTPNTSSLFLCDQCYHPSIKFFCNGTFTIGEAQPCQYHGQLSILAERDNDFFHREQGRAIRDLVQKCLIDDARDSDVVPALEFHEDGRLVRYVFDQTFQEVRVKILSLVHPRYECDALQMMHAPGCFYSDSQDAVVQHGGETASIAKDIYFKVCDGTRTNIIGIIQELERDREDAAKNEKQRSMAREDQLSEETSQGRDTVWTHAFLSQASPEARRVYYRIVEILKQQKINKRYREEQARMEGSYHDPYG